MKGIGANDEIPEGFSFDLDEPQYRSFRQEGIAIDYTLEPRTISIDWVTGKRTNEGLKAILRREGNQISKIAGYTSDRLADVANKRLLRFGNRMAKDLGQGWSAAIEMREGRRYLVLNRGDQP